MALRNAWLAHGHQNVVRRAGEVAVGRLLHGATFGRFINQFNDYSFLSSGWESVVLRADDN